jgi:hypothetical protein
LGPTTENQKGVWWPGPKEPEIYTRKGGEYYEESTFDILLLQLQVLVFWLA